MFFFVKYLCSRESYYMGEFIICFMVSWISTHHNQTKDVLPDKKTIIKYKKHKQKINHKLRKCLFHEIIILIIHKNLALKLYDRPEQFVIFIIFNLNWSTLSSFVKDSCIVYYHNFWYSRYCYIISQRRDSFAAGYRWATIHLRLIETELLVKIF